MKFKEKGIFINCKDEPFVELIMEHKKHIETRTKDVFKGLFDGKDSEFVFLIETGNGVPTIRGEVKIERGCFVDAEVFDKCMRSLACIDRCSKYDSYNGKWCYPITGAYKTKTFPLPKNAVRHGRSWCEFEVTYDEMYDTYSD